MFRIIIVVVVLFAALALVGCGGGNGAITKISSPLEGTWTGDLSWVEVVDQPATVHEIEMIVDSEGRVMGTIDADKPDETVTYSGTVSNGGALSIVDTNRAVIQGKLAYNGASNKLKFTTGTRTLLAETKTGVVMDITRE